MTATAGLTDEQRNVMRKVEGLLRLAGSTTSADEAASATAKAQDLLDQYALDSSMIGAGDDSGARADENLRGGHYAWQREVMSVLGELCSCWTWAQPTWVPRTEAEQNHSRNRHMSRWNRRNKRIWQYRIVGRAVNVAALKVQYDYIMQATERLTREFVSDGLARSPDDFERVVGLGAALRSQRACSFREGVAEAVELRLWERVSEQRCEAEREAAALRERMERYGAQAAGEARGRALVLSDVRQAERDANNDHVVGRPGWSAEQRAARQARADEARRAAEARAQWALENPEEARKEAERNRKEAERAEKRASRPRGPGSRGGTSHMRQVDARAYDAGAEAGKKVGLDTQADGSGRGRGVGHTAGLIGGRS